MAKADWDGFRCSQRDRTRDREIDPEARRQNNARRATEDLKAKLELAKELGIKPEELDL
ncbi:hypothetical protein [Vibrio phage CKB-S2]|nr:hypothetical protein [Vibrio phage CKB-S2]